MKFPKYKIRTITQHDGTSYYTAHVRIPFEFLEIDTWFDSFPGAWEHLDEQGIGFNNIETEFETEAEAIKAIEQHKQQLINQYKQTTAKVTEKIYKS